MGHKISPLALRLGINEPWRSRWFTTRHRALFLEADHLIRTTILELFPKSGIATVIIERKGIDACRVTIQTSRPGYLIGREGQNLRKLQRSVDLALTPPFEKHKLPKPNIEFQIEELKKPFISAKVLAQLAAIDIEKRLPVRKVVKRTIERAQQHKEIIGIRMRVSGRLNGNEIHRSESLTSGRMPLGTFRSVIDYAEERAFCTYGTIGIKVWVYLGDRGTIQSEASA